MYKVFMLLLLLFSLVISGCSKTATYNTLLLHPERIAPIYHRCSLMLQSQVMQDKECLAALQAIQTIKPSVILIAKTPQEFGLKIMMAQEAYAKTKAEIAQMKASRSKQADIMSLETRLKQQRLEIDRLYAIINMETPSP